MGHLKEACGVFGIASTGDVAQQIFYGLLSLQHRGQESAGVSVFNGNIITHKKMGLASEVFSEEMLKKLNGNIGIGHVRYSTAGASVFEHAQPMEFESPKYKISIGFNGNIPNYTELMKTLLSEYQLKTTCDVEGLGIFFLKSLEKHKDIFAASEELLKTIPAAYCITILVFDKERNKCSIANIRDRYGFRPFCIGEKEGGYITASESVALDVLGAKYLGDIQPGSVEVINEDERETRQIIEVEHAHCMFEYVYFARPDSIINKRSVYDVRIKLGKNLTKNCDFNADIVVPVPDTSRPAAEGIARETKIPVVEGLIKNRYIGRTFIMPEQRLRDNAVKMKMNPLRAVLENKSVILVDDSIVRGTTTKKIVNMIKSADTKKVDVWITCPPIVSPCFYGIDMKTYGELIAANNTVDEIREVLGAENLNYQTIDSLRDAINAEGLCTACLTGRYPTGDAQMLADKMKEQTSLKKVKFWKGER